MQQMASYPSAFKMSYVTTFRTVGKFLWKVIEQEYEKIIPLQNTWTYVSGTNARSKVTSPIMKDSN